MARIRVVIVDHNRSKRTTVELPDDIAMHRLLPALAARMGLPLHHEANTIVYKLDDRRTGRRLDDESTLAGASVQSGDELILLPEVTAGGSAQLRPVPDYPLVVGRAPSNWRDKLADALIETAESLRDGSVREIEQSKRIDRLEREIEDLRIVTAAHTLDLDPAALRIVRMIRARVYTEDVSDVEEAELGLALWDICDAIGFEHFAG